MASIDQKVAGGTGGLFRPPEHRLPLKLTSSRRSISRIWNSISKLKSISASGLPSDSNDAMTSIHPRGLKPSCRP